MLTHKSDYVTPFLKILQVTLLGLYVKSKSHNMACEVLALRLSPPEALCSGHSKGLATRQKNRDALLLGLCLCDSTCL